EPGFSAEIGGVMMGLFAGKPAPTGFAAACGRLRQWIVEIDCNLCGSEFIREGHDALFLTRPESLWELACQ
ncbi:hypothetical protein QN391_26015, partial [Pseudomonas sp. CCI1.2]|uniref:hypothetical protein n=1 Tax=unclassified Pseudomonas TaxID=196821 RepID=UPI002B23EB25